MNAAAVIEIGIHALGILIGGTIAGVVAHAMNYVADVDDMTRKSFLAIYILALTVGLSVNYGHPVVTFIVAYLSIVPISGAIFAKLKTWLPAEPLQ